MTIVPAAPPQAIPIGGAFDYVTVDARRRRVFAAHTGAQSLLVLNADTGAVLAQVHVGRMHGVAVDPVTGHVFTGNGTARSVSEVDPVSGTVLRSAAVDGPVDAIAYDAALGRIYADEDDGTRIFVIDAKTMQSIATVTLPGHKPEYLAVDPQTHDVYQNISDLGEYVVVDPKSLAVRTTVKTPELGDNHPLQYDPAFGQIVTEGDGTLSVYDRAGTKRASISVPKGIDQCDLDPRRHRVACAGGGELTVVALSKTGAPSIVAQATIPRGAHTLAVDGRTADVWTVWGDANSAFAERYTLKP